MSVDVSLSVQLLEPIGGAEPCGIDSRDEPNALRLRDEVAKLEALQGSPVDWPLVERLATGLLSDVTKDLKVAAQLAHASLYTRGIAGCRDGVTMLASLCDTYWDGLHPQRPKARSAALVWFVTRSEVALTAWPLSPGDAEQLSSLRDAIERFGNTMRMRLGDQAPDLAPLLDVLNRMQLSGVGVAAQASAPSVSPVASVTPATGQPVGEGETRAVVQPGGASELDTRSWSAAWMVPISDEAPQGKDVRNDPLFLGIRDAVQMAEHPAGGDADWQAVATRCDRLLKEHSKDLRVAAFHAYALYKARGLEGLSVGLAVVGGLLEGHWDGLFPAVERSTRARSSALAWLFPRLEHLGQHPVTLADSLLVARVAASAAYVVEQVHARFAPGEAPATGPLMEQVSRLELSIPSPESTPTPPAVTPSLPSATTSGGPPPTSGPSPATHSSPPVVHVNTATPQAPGGADASEVRAYVRTLARDLMQVADNLLEADPTAPESYRLARFAGYAAINKNPPHDKGRLPQPSPEFVLGGLERIFSAQEWANLIVTAEKTIRANPLLLDAHRYLLLGMQRMGDPYRVAYGVALGELVSLLTRAPELPDLLFSDGKPVAQPATREWLSQVVLAPGKGDTESARPEEGDLTEARKLAAEGKGKQALDVLDRAARALPEGRGAFNLRLAMAEVALGMKANTLAEGIYASLVEDGDKVQLDTWDPPLAGKLYAKYYLCLKSLARDDRLMAERSRMIYRRLCRVDPARALVSD